MQGDPVERANATKERERTGGVFQTVFTEIAPQIFPKSPKFPRISPNDPQAPRNKAGTNEELVIALLRHFLILFPPRRSPSFYRHVEAPETTVRLLFAAIHPRALHPAPYSVPRLAKHQALATH